MFVIHTLLLFAWIPLLEPIPLGHAWTLTAVPLAFAIALVYRAVRDPQMQHLAYHTIRLGLGILLFMLFAGTLVWIFTILQFG